MTLNAKETNYWPILAEAKIITRLIFDENTFTISSLFNESRVTADAARNAKSSMRVADWNCGSPCESLIFASKYLTYCLRWSILEEAMISVRKVVLVGRGWWKFK